VQRSPLPEMPRTGPRRPAGGPAPLKTRVLFHSDVSLRPGMLGIAKRLNDNAIPRLGSE
jgi:hypothetical protein